MRLTKKDKMARYGYKYVAQNRFDNFGEGCQKLGELEDIEDELGIDLITLFKAMKQDTLFIKTATDIRETIKHGEGWGMKSLMYEDGKLIIFTDILYPNEITKKEWLTPIRLQLNDYEKTWALTKEEFKMNKKEVITKDICNEMTNAQREAIVYHSKLLNEYYEDYSDMLRAEAEYKRVNEEKLKAQEEKKARAKELVDITEKIK